MEVITTRLPYWQSAKITVALATNSIAIVKAIGKNQTTNTESFVDCFIINQIKPIDLLLCADDDIPGLVYGCVVDLRPLLAETSLEKKNA